MNGEIVPGLRLITGLVLNYAELGTWLEVVGVPKFPFNGNIEWDLPLAPGFTLTSRVTHTDEQFADAANTLTLDDWNTDDFGARYVFRAGAAPVTLRLTVDTMFDDACCCKGWRGRCGHQH